MMSWAVIHRYDITTVHCNKSEEYEFQVFTPRKTPATVHVVRLDYMANAVYFHDLGVMLFK